MTKRTRDKGFTLIEVVVVLAVIAALVAILTPMLLGYIKDSRLRRAEGDVKTIAAAINALYKDTAVYPGDKASKAYLASDTSSLPSGVTSADVEDLADHLIDNDAGYSTTGRFKWRGPYLESVGLDPWGKSYLVYVDHFTAANANNSSKTAWVLSAGPDQTLDTDPTSDPTSVSDDDIGYRIK